MRERRGAGTRRGVTGAQSAPLIIVCALTFLRRGNHFRTLLYSLVRQNRWSGSWGNEPVSGATCNVLRRGGSSEVARGWSEGGVLSAMGWTWHQGCFLKDVFIFFSYHCTRTFDSESTERNKFYMHIEK